MAVSPAGSKWSVAPFNDNGEIGSYHPVPWEFHQQAMNAGTLWFGGYAPIAEVDNGVRCEIITQPNSGHDSFEVFFVTSDRFIATKNDSLYRFGKKL